MKKLIRQMNSYAINAKNLNRNEHGLILFMKMDNNRNLKTRHKL